jgi:hypothetical protein
VCFTKGCARRAGWRRRATAKRQQHAIVLHVVCPIDASSSSADSVALLNQYQTSSRRPRWRPCLRPAPVVARWGPWTPARARDIELIKQRKLDRLAWAAFSAAATGTRAAPRLAGRCRRCGAAAEISAELQHVTDARAVGNVHIACDCVQLDARVELRRTPGGAAFGAIGSWRWRRCAPAAGAGDGGAMGQMRGVQR